MVAGHLQEKKGLFYIVLNYKDEMGSRKTKWLPTGLSIKGNKKRAEAMLLEARQNFVPPQSLKEGESHVEMLFADYLLYWIKIAKSTIAISTYASYSEMIHFPIEPYFRKLNVTLASLQAHQIQAFYALQLERVSANTVIHYHAIIHRALKYAVKMDLIAANPADKVERPRKERFLPSFYDQEEPRVLLKTVSNTPLEVPVSLAAFYGLRRSEVLGLRWNAVDFKENTLTISHTVVSCCVDGKRMEIAADTTKTKTSLRTLPLVPTIRELLLSVQARQAENRRLCGRCYCKQYMEYICVNEIGERIKPNWLTSTFHNFLEDNGLRLIRFHDLRHSSASLLLANHVPLKQIQEWLGHSDFSTTANIYAHLDAASKLDTADAMLRGLGFEAPDDSAGGHKKAK